MAKLKMYSNDEIAEICGVSKETVQKYAQKTENEINHIKTRTTKTYVWLEEDIERFKNRNTARGRPKKP